MDEQAKRIVEESKRYATIGNTAVKPEISPKHVAEPLKKQKTQTDVQVKRLPRFADVPMKIKWQVAATVIAVAFIIMPLMKHQADVSVATAENNKIINEISELEQQIHLLENEADQKVNIDDVMNVISEEGLIKPSENNIIKVNP